MWVAESGQLSGGVWHEGRVDVGIFEDQMGEWKWMEETELQQCTLKNMSCHLAGPLHAMQPFAVS